MSFRFSVKRGVVLCSVHQLSDGKIELKTSIHGTVVLPKEAVVCATASAIADPLLRMVDFGPGTNGKKPCEALIVARTEKRLPKFT